MKFDKALMHVYFGEPTQCDLVKLAYGILRLEHPWDTSSINDSL